MNPWLAIWSLFICILLRPKLSTIASAIHASALSRSSPALRNPIRMFFCPWLRSAVESCRARMLSCTSCGRRCLTPAKHVCRTSGWAGKTSGIADGRRNGPSTVSASTVRPLTARPRAVAPPGLYVHVGSFAAARAKLRTAASRWNACSGTRQSGASGDAFITAACRCLKMGSRTWSRTSASTCVPNSSRNSPASALHAPPPASRPPASSSSSCSPPRPWAAGLSGKMAYTRTLPVYTTHSFRAAAQACHTAVAAATAAPSPPPSALVPASCARFISRLARSTQSSRY